MADKLEKGFAFFKQVTCPQLFPVSLHTSVIEALLPPFTTKCIFVNSMLLNDISANFRCILKQFFFSFFPASHTNSDGSQVTFFSSNLPGSRPETHHAGYGHLGRFPSFYH